MEFISKKKIILLIIDDTNICIKYTNQKFYRYIKKFWYANDILN